MTDIINVYLYMYTCKTEISQWCVIHCSIIVTTRGIDLCGVMASQSERKHNELTLQKKYDLVKQAEKNTTLSVRELVGIYECRKAQVYQVLKDKAAIVQCYKSNGANDIRQSDSQAYQEITVCCNQSFIVRVIFGKVTQKHLSRWANVL